LQLLHVTSQLLQLIYLQLTLGTLLNCLLQVNLQNIVCELFIVANLGVQVNPVAVGHIAAVAAAPAAADGGTGAAGA
jgi:hypothetical protein